MPAMRALRSMNVTAHAGDVGALVFDPEVGYEAVDAFYRIATREQIATLVKLLESENSYTRLLAVEAHGSVGCQGPAGGGWRVRRRWMRQRGRRGLRRGSC